MSRNRKNYNKGNLYSKKSTKTQAGLNSHSDRFLSEKALEEEAKKGLVKFLNQHSQDELDDLLKEAESHIIRKMSKSRSERNR